MATGYFSYNSYHSSRPSGTRHGPTNALAFNLDTGERDSTKDISLGNLQGSVSSITDGTTLWFFIYGIGGTQYSFMAYNVSDGMRDTSKDFTIPVSPSRTPFSDGTLVYAPVSVNGIFRKIDFYNFSGVKVGTSLEVTQESGWEFNGEAAAVGDVVWLFVITQSPYTTSLRAYKRSTITSGSPERLPDRDITGFTSVNNQNLCMNDESYVWFLHTLNFAGTSLQLNAYNLTTGTAESTKNISFTQSLESGARFLSLGIGSDYSASATPTVPTVTGIPFFHGENQVESMYLGETEVTHLYRGVRLLWRKHVEPTGSGRYITTGFTRTMGRVWVTSGFVNTNFVEWRETGSSHTQGNYVGTWPVQRNFRAEWMEGSPMGAGEYHVARFRLRAEYTDSTRSTVDHFEIRAYIRRSTAAAGERSQASLLDSIVEDTWQIEYGNVTIDIPGPRNSGAAQMDVVRTNGLYNWRPLPASNTALKTLIEGLVAGTIDDEVHLIIPVPTSRVTIEDWGFTSGTMKESPLTINVTSLPVTIVGSATLDNETSWRIYRVAGSTTDNVASGASEDVSVSYSETLTSDFKPDSNGWQYELIGYNNWLPGSTGTEHATAIVRTVKAPSLTAFTATAPSQSSGPGGNTQCVYLNWTLEDGDPVVTGVLSQSGSRTLATLPISRHFTKAGGVLTGNSRIRVCAPAGGGGSTTLTLTFENEGGTSARSVTINWIT